ncbi:BrxA family protein [uncultured Prevotella sp.]|uniref:BrxA family protein n=1 Tax=uncultured Prevotella sp. TaxID=159272 RepID=UPI00258CD273|nr:BrxA family protein [uncultured Prevotella sp.]
MKKNYSPYTAALTGGGFLFEETLILLPLLQAENSEELLQEEKVNNNLLHINAETARSRNIHEIKRRYQTMPPSFWDDFKEMSDNDKIVALFYVILKTYKICFDFHVNVTMRKWISISKSIDKEDLMMEFNEISAKDDFVDCWSDSTKEKVAGAYLTILRKVGMLDKNNHLHSLACYNYGYYLTKGEPWFLEACLLQPYEINNIKKSMI